MRNSTEQLFFKKITFAIFLSGPFPPAKTLHEKQTDLSAYTLGGRKKRLVAYVLLFFKEGVRQEPLKDHVSFLLLGG